MEKTVLQLATDLSVAKSTIFKAISDIGIVPRKVGNRFLLSIEQVQSVSAYVLHRQNISEIPKIISEKSHEGSSGKSLEILIASFKLHIADLQAQLTMKDQQLASMTTALQTAQEQQSVLTAALQAAQQQQATLTAAFTTAQALHAGTIQERLTEHPSGVSDSIQVDNHHVVHDSPAKKHGFFAKLFKKQQ